MRKTELIKIVKEYNLCTRFENGIIKDGVMFAVVDADKYTRIEYEIIKNGKFLSRKTLASTKTTETICRLSNVIRKCGNNIVESNKENWGLDI